MIDADQRELQVARLLEAWPTELDGVVVGGYAVAAYGTPRYSVDVDVVVSERSRVDWADWLKSHHLLLGPGHRVFHQGRASLEVQRWEYRAITLDLMIGGVRDRDSGVTIPGDWLLRSPRSVRLELLSGPLSSQVDVVRLEGLWATKLLAGRPHDLTDLFGIMSQEVNLGEVRELFGRFLQSVALRKFKLVLSRVNDRKTYVDTLSRLLQGSPESRTNLSRWSRFANMVQSCIPVSSIEPA